MKVSCPNCGADVEYLPDTETCYCEHCGSNIEIERLNSVFTEQEMSDLSGNENDYSEIECSTCGAKLVTDSKTIVTKCIFCGSQQIIKERLSGGFKPEFIAPFEVNKETFLEIYKYGVKDKWFVPNWFKNNPDVEEIKGLYVPYYLYRFDETILARGISVAKDSDSHGHHFFTLSYKDKVVVPQDACKSLDDDIMTSIEPFYIDDLKKFHLGYITGFLAEVGDEIEENLERKAKKRALLHAIPKINFNIKHAEHISKGYIDVDFSSAFSQRVFLPVWLLNSWYGGKKYSYVVNGQTGKISGEIPLDKPKFYAFFFIIGVINFLFLALVIKTFSEDMSGEEAGNIIAPLIAFIWGGYFIWITWLKYKYKNHREVINNKIIDGIDEQVEYKEFKSRKEYMSFYTDDDLKKLELKVNSNGINDEELTKSLIDTKNRKKNVEDFFS